MFANLYFRLSNFCQCRKFCGQLGIAFAFNETMRLERKGVILRWIANQALIAHFLKVEASRITYAVFFFNHFSRFNSEIIAVKITGC